MFSLHRAFCTNFVLYDILWFGPSHEKTCWGTLILLGLPLAGCSKDNNVVCNMKLYIYEGRLYLSLCLVTFESSLYVCSKFFKRKVAACVRSRLLNERNVLYGKHFSCFNFTEIIDSFEKFRHVLLNSSPALITKIIVKY